MDRTEALLVLKQVEFLVACLTLPYFTQAFGLPWIFSCVVESQPYVSLEGSDQSCRNCRAVCFVCYVDELPFLVCTNECLSFDV